MGLVHQVAPEDEATSISSHVMEEEGLVSGWIRAAQEGRRPMVTNAAAMRFSIGNGEPSEDGEDFTFENAGSE